MTKEEMERRCEEAINQAGKKTTLVIVSVMAGLEFDMQEWDALGQKNTDQLSKSIGQCYAGLKMLERYVKANPEKIEEGIEEMLAYG